MNEEENDILVKCLHCNTEFEPDNYGVAGAPEELYCSRECELEDDYDEYGSETFEKFHRGAKEQWH